MKKQQRIGRVPARHRAKRLRWAAFAGTIVLLAPLFGQQAVIAEPIRIHPSGLRFLLKTAYELPPIDAALTDLYAGIATEISMQDPDDFGHPYVNDGVVLLPTTSKLSASISTANNRTEQRDALADYEKARESLVEERGPESDATRLRLDSSEVADALTEPFRFVRGTESRRTTQDRVDTVLDFAGSDQFSDAEAWKSTVDQNSGLVILVVTKLTDNLANALVSKFGTDKLLIREEPRIALAPQSGGRTMDDNPYYGGALIYSGVGSCSSGTAWVSAGTYPMITAGHCAPNGDSSVLTNASGTMGEIESGTRENWNEGVGTVHYPGEVVNRGDSALIRMSPGNVSYARVYRGSPTSSSYSTVREKWYRRAAIHDTYCVSGYRTGETCGYEVGTVQDSVRYYNDLGQYTGTARNVVTAIKTFSYRINHGDSGGAVFTERDDHTLAMKGIVSGAGGGVHNTSNDKYYCYPSPQSSICLQIFTDIWEVDDAFPGTLKTG